jgi:hypothetical protein
MIGSFLAFSTPLAVVQGHKECGTKQLKKAWSTYFREKCGVYRERKEQD